MHYRLLMALLLLLPTLGLANKEARPQPSYFQGERRKTPLVRSAITPANLATAAYRYEYLLCCAVSAPTFAVAQMPPQPHNAVSLLRQHSQDGLPSVTWVGHATTLVQSRRDHFFDRPYLV